MVNIFSRNFHFFVFILFFLNLNERDLESLLFSSFFQVWLFQYCCYFAHWFSNLFISCKYFLFFNIPLRIIYNFQKFFHKLDKIHHIFDNVYLLKKILNNIHNYHLHIIYNFQQFFHKFHKDNHIFDNVYLLKKIHNNIHNYHLSNWSFICNKNT